MCLFTSCYKISHLFTSRHKGAFSFLVALLRRLTRPILVKKSWGKHITAPSVLLPMHDPGTSHSLGCRGWQRCGWWGAHRLGPRATMWLMKNRASCWRTTDMDTWRATEPGSFSPPGLGLFATTARLSSAVPIQAWLMKMPVLMAFTAEIRDTRVLSSIKSMQSSSEGPNTYPQFLLLLHEHHAFLPNAYPPRSLTWDIMSLSHVFHTSQSVSHTGAVSVQYKTKRALKISVKPNKFYKAVHETTVLGLCIILTLLSNTKSSRKKTKQTIKSTGSF